MAEILENLSDCIRNLSYATMGYMEMDPILARLMKKLEKCEKDLASRLDPAKVLIALTDDQETGSMSPVYGVIGTVPVTVVVVNHRKNDSDEDRLRVLNVKPIASPTEFVEAVSDEAAPYIATDNTLINLIAAI